MIGRRNSAIANTKTAGQAIASRSCTTKICHCILTNYTEFRSYGHEFTVALATRGYTDEEIGSMIGGNYLRAEGGVRMIRLCTLASGTTPPVGHPLCAAWYPPAHAIGGELQALGLVLAATTSRRSRSAPSTGPN